MVINSNIIHSKENVFLCILKSLHNKNTSTIMAGAVLKHLKKLGDFNLKKWTYQLLFFNIWSILLKMKSASASRSWLTLRRDAATWLVCIFCFGAWIGLAGYTMNGFWDSSSNETLFFPIPLTSFADLLVTNEVASFYTVLYWNPLFCFAWLISFLISCRSCWLFLVINSFKQL